MATELSNEHTYTDANISSHEQNLLSIFYGCENKISFSTDSTIYNISDQSHKPALSTHSLKLSLTKFDIFLDLSDTQDFSFPSLGNDIAFDIPVSIDSKESVQHQMCVFSENYESLLNKNSPLSLKYLCREFILALICRRNETLYDIKIDSIAWYFNKLLYNQCYWRFLSLPVSVKLYLNGCIPICTHAKLYVSRDSNPAMGSPYDLRVLPQVKIVRISGGQSGSVAINTEHPTTAKIEDFIIFPSRHSPLLPTCVLWIMVTIAPNHFIFESAHYPDRYIFAPDPTGKTYTRESSIFLSRPFYAGPENVFSLIEGGTPYIRRYNSGCVYGIKSVKWSTNNIGIFWRWQSNHYHQASKTGDKYQGDECYWIESVASTH